MDDKPTVDELLLRFRDGDVAAGEELFRAYEPYLRMVVRRRLSPNLRPKFDSIDIVQSIWADVFHRFADADWEFKDAQQLRAFLATVARNRFIDRSRHHLRGKQHIDSYDNQFLDHLPQTKDMPSRNFQAGDLWERILSICPPAHRRLLELKRDGFSLDEIAAETGLHKSSVRRILYDLARRLAIDDPAT